MLEPLASEGHEPTVTVSSEALPEGLGTNDWIDRALARQQASLLPEVLTRRTGLGPRPRGAEAPVRTTAGELAAVVAKMDSPTPTTGAAGASLGELHDYWALDISAGGDAGLVRRVEVLERGRPLAGRARRAGGDPEPRDIDPGVAAPRELTREIEAGP